MPIEQPKNLPYEAMFICPVDIPQKDIDVIIDKVKKTVTDSGATLNGLQVWGRRRLAYPIKRQREGIYVYVDFSGNNTSASVLTQFFRVTDKVIRHLVVRKDEKGALAAAQAAAQHQSRMANAAGQATENKGDSPLPKPQVSKSKEVPST